MIIKNASTKCSFRKIKKKRFGRLIVLGIGDSHNLWVCSNNIYIYIYIYIYIKCEVNFTYTTVLWSWVKHKFTKN